MKLLSRLVVAAGLLLLAGCASTPTKVDTGTIRAATFNFVDGADRPGVDLGRSGGAAGEQQEAGGHDEAAQQLHR